MRYNLESTLPINAFSPRGGRGPFSYGMTLEGGVIETVGDVVGGTIETVGEGIIEGGRSVNNFVKDEIPGGWATVAAIAVPYAAPYFTGAALTAGQAAALAAATSATAGAIEGRDPEDILKSAALSAAGSYGLSSLGGTGESIDLPSETPYIDMPDGAELLTPESIPLETAIQTSPSPSYETNINDLGAGTSSYGEANELPDSGADSTFTPKKIDLSQANPDVSNVSTTDLGVTAIDNPFFDFDADTGAAMRDYASSPEIIAASSAPPPLSPEEKLKDDFFKEFVNNPQNPRPGFFQDPLKNLGNRASDAIDYLQNAPEKTYDYLTKTPIKEMGSDLYDFAGRNKYELGIGALMLSGAGGQPQPQPQQYPAGYTPSGPYTGGYGSSGGVADPYLLRNRVTAQDVYRYQNPYDRYATVNRRYAKGGEVKHFFLGGITNTLKSVLPYAGIFAAPFISSPAAAVGIGALSSGFGGRSGSNFDMKRALMGGIAAYGASTLGAGLEAAGATPAAAAPISDLATVPPGTVGEGIVNQTSALVKEPSVAKSFFRDTDAMQRGVGNLLSSDSDAASKAFATKAGTFKTGIPLVMGTTGMMAIDEANKMREEAELAAGPARRENADMLARIAKGRKRAEEAVMANPYMYAMGGQVDDELGGDYSAMGMDQGNMQKGLFGMGYAEGGNVSKKERQDFLDMINFEARTIPPARNIEGIGFASSPPAVQGRLGGNIDALGGNIRAGASGMAMMGPDRKLITSPGMVDVGYRSRVGPGELDIGLQRAIRSMPGRDKDYAVNANYKIPFAEGGTPRFLSGGGDGMSDSIPATIGGTQEARLADGEFVIPADVVSHLGNGSSKAGAKQLYSMMDRVRKARTGNEKQGRQIKPNKLMPA